MSQKFNPHADLAAYKKTVEDRGYNAWSKDALEAWNKEHGHFSPVDLQSLTDFYTKDFLNSMSNPAHSDFQANRARYKDEFGGSDAAVKAHFKNQVNLEHGRPYRGDSGLHRDTSYEQRMLKSANNISSSVAQGEASLLKDLMNSRWAAQGYSDDDQAYVDRFFNSYAIALKPAQSQVVSAL